MDFIKSISDLEGKTRAQRMLEAGNLKVTVKSRKTGEYITVQFAVRRRNHDGHGKNWLSVHPRDATHIFVQVPRPHGAFSDKIGTLYPDFRFAKDRKADSARVWAAMAAWNWVIGGIEHTQAEFTEASECGRCRRELTDPESIARGIGPECFSKMTGSQHQVKVKS